MNLIVISNPGYFIGESFLINQLFENGLEIFHLRKRDLERKKSCALIEAIDPVFHHRIALHQDYSIAADYGIKRFHHTEKNRLDLFGHVWHNHIVLSTSIHQHKDLKTLSGYDYTFFSPVFDSLSKPGYKGVLKQDFKLDKKVLTIKVIALGGISLSNIDVLRRMGFDGIALLGSIWNNLPSALKNFKEIKERCEQIDPM